MKKIILVIVILSGVVGSGIFLHDSFAEQTLPDWVKNIFVWYGKGQISEDEVLNAIKFLVENKIIILSDVEKSTGMMNQMMTGMSFSTNAPIIMPMIDGYYNGNKIYFVHTEISDPDMAHMMSTMINFPTLYVPELKNISEEKMAKVYVFTNGIHGGEPYGGGPFMYQIDVFDSVPGKTGYSQYRIPYLITWNDNAKPRILVSESEILKAQSNGELTIQKTSNVVNAPVVTWEITGNYGKILEKSTKFPNLFESMPGVEGELKFIDANNYLAIFKLHSMKSMEMMNP